MAIKSSLMVIFALLRCVDFGDCQASERCTLLSRQGEIEARLTRLENRLAPSDGSVATTGNKESTADVGAFTNAICDL